MTNIPARKMGISVRERIYMKLANFTFRVHQGEFYDGVESAVTEASDFGIKPLWISFRKRKGTMAMELTGMTMEELELFERGMAAAIEAAKEVVKFLDDNAATEYDDDTPMIPLRAIRTMPPVVFRRIRPFIGTEWDPEAISEAENDDDMTSDMDVT